MKVKSLSHVWLFASPWRVAYRAPLSMGFSRQEYWSGLPFPSLGDFPNLGPQSIALFCAFSTFSLVLKVTLYLLRQASFYYVSLYCASQMSSFLGFFLFVCKLKLCGNPVSSMSMGTSFPTAFAHSIYLCHILIILTTFPTISLLLYLLKWSVISSLSCYFLILLGSHKTHSWETVHLIDRCYMHSPCSTNQASQVSPPLLWPPDDLRHNNTEMRPINSPLIASTFSGERFPCLSL